MFLWPKEFITVIHHTFHGDTADEQSSPDPFSWLRTGGWAQDYSGNI